jgi:hypothetical protein
VANPSKYIQFSQAIPTSIANHPKYAGNIIGRRKEKLHSNKSLQICHKIIGKLSSINIKNYAFSAKTKSLQWQMYNQNKGKKFAKPRISIIFAAASSSPYPCLF